MFNLKDYIYKQQNKRYLSSLEPRVKLIRKYIQEYTPLDDSELQAYFRKYAYDLDCSDRMERCFALGYLAVERIKGLKLYDVQLLGAIALYEGKIAEMKTGEGKTITSFLPALLRATEGQVHVCTVNEYLAKRDKEYLEPLYNFFGFSVSLNLQEDSRIIKKHTYERNIVYGISSTFGFDYLYDNMIQNLSERCCPAQNRFFALIDEVDLILIDEARTPLIVGAPFKGPVENILYIDRIVKKLTPDDYIVNQEKHCCYLTKSGEDKVMEYTQQQKSKLYQENSVQLLHLIHQSLIANYLYKPDVEYTIVEGNVCIIDSYTGRIQPDRRFNNGLHQALEAKHFPLLVDEIKEETRTTATINLQNFFKMYSILSGMSGTAHEDRTEFEQVYHLQVVEIPTNKPLNRVDLKPTMDISKSDKWDRVVDKVKEYHSEDFPVLIGTSSVEDSEVISSVLSKSGLKHTVLNAKQDKHEAEIISKAGLKGSITVATNMAGRGTDIILESKEHPLVVFVTELNESSRIDNQLKGRTSRQGDYGITETCLSTEDSIFSRSSLGARLKAIRESGQPATSKLIHFITNEVQREFEDSNSSIRQNALKYDDVIKEQRQAFYNSRDVVLQVFDEKSLLNILNQLRLPPQEIIEIGRKYNGDVRSIQALILLAMDKSWIEHLDRLESLKKAISWRSQSGHNPIILFQNEAQKLYDTLKLNIKYTVLELAKEYTQADLRNSNPYNGEGG